MKRRQLGKKRYVARRAADCLLNEVQKVIVAFELEISAPQSIEDKQVCRVPHVELVIELYGRFNISRAFIALRQPVFDIVPLGLSKQWGCRDKNRRTCERTEQQS